MSIMGNLTIENIIEDLNSELECRRFKHSINVMETSASLAQHYGADVDKARLAGLLHDCGKNVKGDEARAYVDRIGYRADEIEWAQPRLLHGIIGEHLARVKYGVSHEEVLGAIRWHTTGRAGMTLLEKIIYIADYIEPARSFEGIDAMRQMAFEHLDRCVVLCSDSTIQYILKKGVLLHENTVQTRNYSMMLIKKEKI